jgi:hypothetical protein
MSFLLVTPPPLVVKNDTRSLDSLIRERTERKKLLVLVLVARARWLARDGYVNLKEPGPGQTLWH